MTRTTSKKKGDETDEHKLNLKTFSLFKDRLWPYMRRYRLLFFGSTFFVLLSTLCALTTPWLLGYVVDHVLVPRAMHLLFPITLLYFCVDCVRAFSLISQTFLVTKFGQKILHDLRQDLLKQYQFYPLAEFNRTPTGRLVTRLINDTSSLQDLFTGGFAVALGQVAIVSGILIWLIVLHPLMGLVCTCLFPLMYFSARYFGGQIRLTYRLSRAALSRVNAFLSENISGMSIIQVFNQQDAFRSRFKEISQEFTDLSIENVRAFSIFQPTIAMASSLSMTLLIWYGGYQRINDAVTLGLLVSFMGYLQALYAPIRDLTEKYNLFVSAMTSCERIFEFMDRPREPGTDSSKRDFDPITLQGKIEFRNVWFRYEIEGKWILRDVSFIIEPGEKIGIVGHTGAGKTTLSALLMRFYDIEKGVILIDGKDISTLDKRSLRSRFAYIQQDPFLFSGSVEDNILLWEESRRRDFDSLPPIARQGIAKFNLDLAKQIYEKGANLSAGERQVIAFLRALTQNPKILILDEATAHVDSIAEGWITDVSGQTFSQRTVLIIAHRLATLKTVDRIFVLHHGELVESGTHSELLRQAGIYRRLYEIQSRREELTGELANVSEAKGHL